MLPPISKPNSLMIDGSGRRTDLLSVPAVVTDYCYSRKKSSLFRIVGIHTCYCTRVAMFPSVVTV